MRIIYAGAEIGSNRTVLESAGVTAMGVSYARIVARGMPKTKKWLVRDRFADDVMVVATPGISETKGMSVGELETFGADYQDWVVDNADRLTGFTEFDPPQLGSRWIAEQRPFWADAGNAFWPVWDSNLGYPELMRLAEGFAEVAIPYAAVESQTGLSGQSRAIASNRGTVWHGIGIASPENLRQVTFATAMTGSWTSPMRRGETIVWDGTALKRYPKKMKDQARPRYKSVIERAGLDYDAIINDDAKEVTRLALWSYGRLEDDMNKKTGDRHLHAVDVDNVTPMLTGMRGIVLSDADHSHPATGKPTARVPAPRAASERRFLPVMDVSSKTIVETGEDGRDTLRDVPVLSSTGVSLRQCNTCFVAANCPAFKPDSECAYSLPVEVRTKDQLVALLNAVIEMQGSRVAFARFAEELNGGYPDPNTGQEIDRLFKLVKSLKEMEDNKEFVRMTFERQGGAGVLSSIFGDRAQVLKELDGGPMGADQTTRLIQQTLES